MKKILLLCLIIINVCAFTEDLTYSFKGLSTDGFEIDNEYILKISSEIKRSIKNLPGKKYTEYSEDNDLSKYMIINSSVSFYERLELDGKVFIRLDIDFVFKEFLEDEWRTVSGFNMALGGFRNEGEDSWVEVLGDIEKNILFNINKFPDNINAIKVQGFFVGEVLINAGTEDGYKPGDEFEVYFSNSSHKAVIKIEHIYENSALCSIVKNGKYISKGQTAEYRKQGLFYNNYFSHINKFDDSYVWSSGVNFIYRKSKINIYPYIGVEIFPPFRDVYETDVWSSLDGYDDNLTENPRIAGSLGWHIARHIGNFYIAGNVSAFIYANIDNDSGDAKFTHWGTQTGAFIGYSFSSSYVLGIEGGREYFLSRDPWLYNNNYLNYFGISLIVRK